MQRRRYVVHRLAAAGGGAAVAEKAEANVADIVAGAEVELAQRANPRQRFEPRVRHAEAEAEIEAGEVGEPVGNVAQRFIGQFLTILQTQLFKGFGAAAHVAAAATT